MPRAKSDTADKKPAVRKPRAKKSTASFAAQDLPLFGDLDENVLYEDAPSVAVKNAAAQAAAALEKLSSNTTSSAEATTLEALSESNGEVSASSTKDKTKTKASARSKASSGSKNKVKVSTTQDQDMSNPASLGVLSAVLSSNKDEVKNAKANTPKVGAKTRGLAVTSWLSTTSEQNEALSSSFSKDIAKTGKKEAKNAATNAESTSLLDAILSSSQDTSEIEAKRAPTSFSESTNTPKTSSLQSSDDLEVALNAEQTALLATDDISLDKKHSVKSASKSRIKKDVADNTGDSTTKSDEAVKSVNTAKTAKEADAAKAAKAAKAAMEADDAKAIRAEKAAAAAKAIRAEKAAAAAKAKSKDAKGLNNTSAKEQRSDAVIDKSSVDVKTNSLESSNVHDSKVNQADAKAQLLEPISKVDPSIRSSSIQEKDGTRNEEAHAGYKKAHASNQSVTTLNNEGFVDDDKQHHNLHGVKQHQQQTSIVFDNESAPLSYEYMAYGAEFDPTNVYDDLYDIGNDNSQDIGDVPDYIREANEESFNYYDYLDHEFARVKDHDSTKSPHEELLAPELHYLLDSESRKNDAALNIADFALDEEVFTHKEQQHLKSAQGASSSSNLSSPMSLNTEQVINEDAEASSNNKHDKDISDLIYPQPKPEPINLPKDYEPKIQFEGIRDVVTPSEVQEDDSDSSQDDTKALLNKLSFAPNADVSDSKERFQSLGPIEERADYKEQVASNAESLESSPYGIAPNADLTSSAVPDVYEKDAVRSAILSEDEAYIEWHKDLDIATKDSLRIGLAEKKYRRYDIYNDVYYFKPVDPIAKLATKLVAQKWGLEKENKDTPSRVLEFASQVEFISKIDLAFVTYLNDHFPLGNLYDQEQFNVIVLALFSLMQNGDICINLNGLNSVFDVLMGWYEYQKREEVDGEKAQNLNRFIDTALVHAPHSIENVYELLLKSPAVGSKNESNSPLVLDINRLYVRRYYKYELAISEYISNVEHIYYSDEEQTLIRDATNILFSEQYVNGDVNHQKIATLLSTVSNFTVISGGPGTGKTTTVMRILLLLICLDKQNRVIELCAPTGKAAARMGESIIKQLKDPNTAAMIHKLSALFNLDANEIIATIPKEAITVQRLLKVRPNHATPIYNRENQLQCDVLVVDEVSMLDMALFYRVLEALPPHCKLIMLGDKDQLSSVEAGAILGEVCQRLNDNSIDRISSETLSFISKMSGYSQEEILNTRIAEHTALLQFSYRSKDVPEIGVLAKLINESSLFFDDYLRKNSYAQKKEQVVDNPYIVYSENGQYILEGSMEEYLQQSEQNGSSYGGQSHLFYRYYDMKNRELKDLFFKSRQKAIKILDLPAKALSWKKHQDYLQNQHDKEENSVLESSYAEQELDRAYPGRVAFFEQYLNLSEANVEEDVSNSKEVLSAVINKPLANCLPAISNIILNDDDKLIDNYRNQIAKSCVRRGRADNYSSFLEKLAENDFCVSTDHEERDQLFKLMDRFRVLCSNHNGMLGDKALNEFISKEVKYEYLRGFGNFSNEVFFPGQIIIITKNDPVLGLVNGYVGFCAYDASEVDLAKEEAEIEGGLAFSRKKAEASGEGINSFDEKGLRRWYKQKIVMKRTLRVFIPVSVEEIDGKSFTKVKTISTLLVTSYDTGFAMSIHKSQGSEYDKVMIVLSEKVNRVLTKELVYTGVTRAKKCVELVARERCLKYSIAHSVDRESGLSYRLQQNGLEDNVT